MDIVNELIQEFAGKIKYVYTYRTAGDYTFQGMIAEFLRTLRNAPIPVYGVYDMQADSMVGIPILKSIHHTLEGAIKEIPEYALKMERETYGDYVKHYSYFAIKPLEVKP